MSFYTATGSPANLTRGASSLIRNEFLLIQSGFNKFPSLVVGNANYVLKVNSAGDAVVTASITDDGAYGYSATPPVGDNSTKICTTAFANALAFAAALPGQAGSAGKFVTTNGTNASWGNPIGINAVSKTANYTAVAGDNYPQDTTGGAFTITLPSSPVVGDAPILVKDIAGTWSTNALTIDPGANKIKGTTGVCNCRINNFSAWMVWTGATYGWDFL